MKKKSSSVTLTAVCLLLGLGMGIQSNTIKVQDAVEKDRHMKEMTEWFNRISVEKDDLTEELEKKEAENKDLQSELAQNQQSVQSGGVSQGQDMEELRRMSGLTDVTGRGIQVILNDSTKTGENPDAYVIHAEDILSVINELKGAGAEAISINGERIVGNSAITCSGPVLTVNGSKVAAPFVILAAGDSDVLASALNFPGGIVDNLTPWGISVDIQKQDSLTIPAYKNAGGKGGGNG